MQQANTAGSDNANPHNIIVLHGEALHPELVLGPGHDDRAPEGCRSEACWRCDVQAQEKTGDGEAIATCLENAK